MLRNLNMVDVLKSSLYIHRRSVPLNIFVVFTCLEYEYIVNQNTEVYDTY